MKLSIIIPVYNERDTIGQLLDAVLAQRVPGFTREVIVIDDCSTDGTRDILRKFEKRCRIIYKERNEGKGSALHQGFASAQGEIILVQDADLEYRPSDYPVMLKPFTDAKVNIVYGSRFLGPHLSTMFVYELGNKFVTLVTNLLFNTNITDMETGYKAFRKTVLSKFTLREKSFDFEPEFTVKALKNGFQIYEVPISYFGRKFSEGKKLTWRDGIRALYVLIKYRILP